MALAPIHDEARSPDRDRSLGPAQRGAAAMVRVRLFFIFGGITSLNDVLIPKLKHLYSLNYFEAMLIQFAFFTAYALISMPGAALVKRFGICAPQ